MVSHVFGPIHVLCKDIMQIVFISLELLHSILMFVGLFGYLILWVNLQLRAVIWFPKTNQGVNYNKHMAPINWLLIYPNFNL